MTLPPASGPDGSKSGNRDVSMMVSRHLTDFSALGWNPTNGNMVLTGQLLNVHGVGRDLTVGWRYNSLNDARPTLSVGGAETALTVAADNTVTYTAPDGGTYAFVPAGTGQWTMPPGLNATITTFTTTTVTIRFNDTGFTNDYVYDGSKFALKYANDQNATAPNRITYTYNASGLLAQIDDTVGGRPVKFFYEDPANPGQPSRITDDALSRTISIAYGGPSGAMSTITDATGATLDFGYGAPSKRITTVTDSRGTVTTLAYDTTTKQLVQSTYAAGAPEQSIWQYGYYTVPVEGSFAQISDPNGKITTYRLNPLASNQVIQIRGPEGTSTQLSADAHDNQTSFSAAGGNGGTYTYNTANSLTKVTSSAGTGGTGGEISFAYPANTGNPLSNYQPSSTTSSEGNVTTNTYDSNTNRRHQTQAPGGLGGTPVVAYQGDLAGTNCGAKKGETCTSTDGKGNVTTFAYDAKGNPSTITRPAPLGVITNTYDDASRLVISVDGKGQTTHYDYDDDDRLIQIDHGVNCASLCVTYTYDQAGNLSQREDDTGITTYSFDKLNRATSKTGAGTTTSATYDGASNVLTYVDATGTVTYRYDGMNRVTFLAEPGGSCPATPSFPNATKCTGFEYDTASRRTAVKYPSGVKNASVYDGASRTTSITATDTAGTVLASRAYTYTTNGTKNGGLIKTTTTETGAVSTYSYDAMNRLTSTVAGPTTETWGYDANSNRTSAVKTGAATVYAAFNGADQLCWTAATVGTCATTPTGATAYAYDANGNTTAAGPDTSTYNKFDQLTSTTRTGATTAFGYTGLGNDERLTAGSTSFVNGSLGVTRQTVAGVTTSFIRDPNGSLVSMRTSVGSFYYTTDILGSTILLTDSAQTKVATYAYDSWGNVTSSGAQAANNPWQYAGGYKDVSTGYTKFGARYYNPAIGRFTQVDPSGQEANRYAYAGCNPISFADPSGLSLNWRDIASQTVAAAADLIATTVIGLALAPLCLGVVTCIGVALAGLAGGTIIGDATAKALFP
ncbi:RHS repeat-associated core domain-containing protein [Cryobacterium sp. 5B3]|nr:RHS repeat-associated core domain-containing protein [Cryobacterium sp. 5B3]MDY7542127.1 RHS repeat-associated core domain-containing protein [Cryobacterium sp. 5B3]MEB0275956.1 RHS repeat-associated core domain-containing protein [Cryobacterium sp. 5B3]